MARTYVYATTAMLQSRMGLQGLVEAYTDKTTSGTTTYASAPTDEIERASDLIDAFLGTKYPTPELNSANGFIRKLGTDIAVWGMYTRKGNPAPPGAQSLYDLALELLRLIHSGKMAVPEMTAAQGRLSSIPFVRPLRRHIQQGQDEKFGTPADEPVIVETELLT